MEDKPYGYPNSLTITEEQKERILAYLVQHSGPAAPPLDTKRHLPKTWVEDSRARRYVVTEYELLPGAEPHDVAVDSRGIGWVNERKHGNREAAQGFIGRFDPITWIYT